MLSMEPAIKRGLTFWDRALTPADEFAARVELVRAEMKRRGLVALIVAGDMYEDADLIYLVGGAVDGTLVLTADHDPAIFTKSGSRESFFLRELTWIEDLSYAGPLIGSAVRKALHARGVTVGRIGAAGLQTIARAPYRDLVAALSDFAVEDFGDALGELRKQTRPREVAATRIALGIVDKAAAAANAAFAAGATNAQALIAAERSARLDGAWDFRALANLDADDLRPFERPSAERRAPLLLWIAARYQGYWADRAVGATAGAAACAVAAMTAAAKAGVRAAVVAQAGLAELPEDARALALAYGLGNGIGGALDAGPMIHPQNDEPLRAGALLSLRAFARVHGHASSFASSVVEIDAAGASPLKPLLRAAR